MTPVECAGTTFYDKKLKRYFVTRIKELVLEDLTVEITPNGNQNTATSKVVL